jgi:hypothetical protein
MKTTIQTKLAMRLIGPRVSIETARTAAIQVAAQLDNPSVLEFLAPTYLNEPGATLCQTPKRLPVVSTPTALFSQMKISITDVPDAWLSEYAAWMDLERRSHEYRVSSLRLECEADDGTAVTDPVIAGLMLYLRSAKTRSEIRNHWMKVALKAPVGAWLAAEGLHTPEERGAIMEAVRPDSRLSWWVSQIPGFGKLSIANARTQFNLYSGLIMAFNGGPDDLEKWITTTALAGCEREDAACAALVLQPNAKRNDRNIWLSTLQQSACARHAYETVKRAQFTWSCDDWKQLKSTLRPAAVSNAKWLFHWFRDIEPESASSVLGDCSAILWGVELLNALPQADDYAFRFRLGEQLGTTCETSASLALTWLNQRQARGKRESSL